MPESAATNAVSYTTPRDTIIRGPKTANVAEDGPRPPRRVSDQSGAVLSRTVASQPTQDWSFPPPATRAPNLSHTGRKAEEQKRVELVNS